MKISLAVCAGMAVIFFPQSALNTAPLPIWWQKLGWTLVHSLWQMAIIAVLASVAVRLLHKRTAHVRYVVAISFLWLMVIAPAITWQTIGAVSPTDGPSIKVAGDDSKSILAPGKTIASNSGKPTDAGTDWQLVMLPAEDLPPRFDPNPAPSSRATQFPRLARTSPLFGGADRILSSFKPWLRHVVLAWLLGVALSCLRPVTGLWVQWQLRHHGLSAVTEDVQHLLNNLAKRMRLKCFVQVSESVIARAPMVVGYFNPLILLPASVLTGLTLDQLKSLLAHELAHIRRHDWIVNAIQVVIETLMFYHPAVWWLSNRIRNERELCCDDLAISVVQDKVAYGQMLLALEQMRPPVGFATAATGGDLVQRVRRLLPDHGVRARDNCGWLAGTIILLILITGLAGWSVTSTLASNSGSGTDIPAAERDSGDLDSAEQGAVSRPADKWTVVQGRIVVEGQTGIPAGLKLQRRITGGNFAEQVKDVEFNKLGEFSFEVPYDLAFVTVYATSTETAPGSSPRFEVRQGQPVDPLTIKLTRGFPAQLVLRSRDGSQPKSGVATVSLRNVFEPRLGSYPVTQQGKVTIPHCPSDQLQIDLWMPGFEEQRIYRSLSAVEATEVIVEPTPAARFQLVDSHGRPVPGANIRLFSRVRAGFFMSPRIQRESRPVWATSDDQGRVELTTLCKIDPMPTNMPGPAEYAFEINSPGLAPSYIGNVRAGSDLGRIVLSDSLSVQGQIIRDAQRPERVHVKWRQATVAQGTDAGKGDWTTATLEEKMADWHSTCQACVRDLLTCSSLIQTPPFPKMKQEACSARLNFMGC